MPSGTGKTVSLLSLIVSYQQVAVALFDTSILLIAKSAVSSHQAETHILLTNGARDREGVGRAEATNEVPYFVC